ncbi:ATP-binding protein [Chloroflexota bacterium]
MKDKQKTKQQLIDELAEMHQRTAEFEASETERKRVENELRESEKRYRELADLLPQTVFELDGAGNFTSVNLNSIEIFGHTLKETDASWPALQMFAPDDRDRVKENFQGVLSGEELGGAEYTALAKDGSKFPVVAYASPIMEGNKGVGLRGIVVDITKFKQLEEKVVEYEELNKLKSNLLSTVSHELRTPLAIIKGYSTMLVDYDQRLGPGEKKKSLLSIDRATDRLTELVEGLLDMSRLEAGLLKLDKKPTSILKLIKETVAEAKVRAPRHEIVLNPTNRLPMVDIDARRIRQVLDNIIDNAVKYSEEGTRVVIEARRVGSEMQVSVVDQGIGIPAEDLERVFDRMYRIEQRLSPEVVGLGLGLAICKGLIQEHGGRIWAESELGKGSTFYFAVPIETTAERQGHGKEL